MFALLSCAKARAFDVLPFGSEADVEADIGRRPIVCICRSILQKPISPSVPTVFPPRWLPTSAAAFRFFITARPEPRPVTSSPNITLLRWRPRCSLTRLPPCSLTCFARTSQSSSRKMRCNWLGLHFSGRTNAKSFGGKSCCGWTGRKRRAPQLEDAGCPANRPATSGFARRRGRLCIAARRTRFRARVRHRYEILAPPFSFDSPNELARLLRNHFALRELRLSKSRRAATPAGAAAAIETVGRRKVHHHFSRSLCIGAAMAECVLVAAALQKSDCTTVAGLSDTSVVSSETMHDLLHETFAGITGIDSSCCFHHR